MLLLPSRFLLAVSLLAVLFLTVNTANADAVKANRINSNRALAEDVNLRIDTFDEIDKLFKALRFKVVNQRSTDRQGALELSNQLVELTHHLPDLFAVPSAKEVFPQSRSRPEIWSRKAFFDTQMIEFVEDLKDINDEIKAGSLTKAGQLIDVTAKGCRRCHNSFRYK